MKSRQRTQVERKRRIAKCCQRNDLVETIEEERIVGDQESLRSTSPPSRGQAAVYGNVRTTASVLLFTVGGALRSRYKTRASYNRFHLISSSLDGMRALSCLPDQLLQCPCSCRIT